MVVSLTQIIILCTFCKMFHLLQSCCKVSQLSNCDLKGYWIQGQSPKYTIGTRLITTYYVESKLIAIHQCTPYQYVFVASNSNKCCMWWAHEVESSRCSQVCYHVLFVTILEFGISLNLCKLCNTTIYVYLVKP